MHQVGHWLKFPGRWTGRDNSFHGHVETKVLPLSTPFFAES